jgi:capsular exopolysaccharide synthesis family protein
MKQPGSDKPKKQFGNEEMPGGEAVSQSHPGYQLPREIDTAQEGAGGLDLRRLLGLALAYWWLILLIGLLGTGGAVAYCLLTPAKYRAVCQYEIFSERLLNIGMSSTMEAQTRAREHQVILLQSQTLHSRVTNKLQPEWESRIGDLSAEVTVRMGRPNTVIDIAVDAINEEYALEFLQELIAAYDEMRRVEEMTANETAVRQLRLEKIRLSNEMQDARQRLVDFHVKNNIEMTELQKSFDKEFMDSLMDRMQQLRMERAIIGTQLQSLRDANAPTVQDVLALTMEAHVAASAGRMTQVVQQVPVESTTGLEGETETEPSAINAVPSVASLPGVADTAKWQQYERLLSQLQIRYNDNLKRFRENHPSMLQLKQQIEEVKQNIAFESEIARRRLQARYDALKIQEDALRNITQQWQQQPTRELTVAQQAELAGLRAEVSRLSNLVNGLSTKIIDVSAQSSEAFITRPILEPRSIGKVWPMTVPIVTVAGGFSVAAGIALALALFYFDTRFLDVIAIEQRLGLPFIGGVPRWERVLRNYNPEDLVIMDRSKPNAASEAYRSLRISIESRMQDKQGYALLLTSADAGEGKSVTCANLGIAFSWIGKRVLLLDADLRRPSLHNVLEQKNPDQGLTQLLMGEVADWREIVHRTDYENVDFIPAGKFVYEAAELCSARRLSDLMMQLSGSYDLIMLDSAPVGRIVDTAMIAKGCDGVLLVSLHGKASFPAIRHALRRLEGANVIGFCLNAIDIPRSHSGYYGSYSGYRWRYGLYSYYDYYSRTLYGYDSDYARGEDENAEEEGGEQQPS